MENDHDGALEDAREPLMLQNSSCEEGSGSQCSSNNTGVAWMVYLSTFVAVAGSFEVGSCSGYSSPTQKAIREDLSLSIAEYSLFGSILTVGAMIGAITSGPIADYIGRKGAMRFSSTFCAAGWLAIYFAKVPVFIAEIAPTNLRGTLTTVTQLMVATGVSVAFIIGTVLRWRVLALTGLIPCLILHVGLFLIPESPRWLAKRGREKEFETTLQKLRGRAADISYEAIEIKDYIETLERLPKAKLLDLFQRRNLHPIGVGLMVLQQFGGINAVCFYASSIFEVAGFSPSVGTIIYAILQVVFVVLNTTIIDKVGRKPLLLVSASGLVIACLITGLSFYLKVHELALKSAPMLAVTGILIFPLNIKGVAGSLATLVNWFCAWAVSFTFNFLMSWSSYGTFILYAAINAMTIAFVALLVPETKGRTLEQIQAAIR
ncbi:hypothetical protein POTOM_047013 [Populus tomentosa]|uniref:Major facilitator superfamily (MFS) profile domain-containing protein n=1 Tax=Populus tomentosa TaxID=118781 RepID=A0A8X7YFR9_POPTO|nr:hypothetical protein POTOM_047013 [Populus tomentosa]